MPLSDIPIDIKQIAEAMADLNIARKNVVIYPPEHVQVKASIDRALKSLDMVLKKIPELTIAIAKATILIGDEDLGGRNVGWNELARSLSQHEIAAICFYPGIEKEELLSFLYRIAKPLENKQNDLSSTIYPHIQVQLIDYSQLHITEEAEIWRDKDVTRMEKTSFWKDFVTHLVAGRLSKSEDAALLPNIVETDPLELAGLLNQGKIDSNSVLRVYQQMLSSQTGNPGESSESYRIAASLSGLNTLLQALNQELRMQFLSVTFNYLSEQPESVQAALISSGISRDLLYEMLHHANQSGNEISPSLIRLLRKLADIQGLDFGQAPMGDGNPNKTTAADLHTLLKREDYEEFVSSQYDTILKKIETTAKLEKVEGKNAFPIDEYLPTLDEKYLSGQIACMLLAFIGEDIHADEYQVYVDKLVVICRELLDGGNFELIINIFNILNQHSIYKRVPEIRAIAEKTVLLFKEPLFTSKAIQAFHIHHNEARQAVFDFLVSLGPQIVPDALNLYVSQADFESNQHLFNILAKFPEHTLTEAHKRLRDTRSDYVRNLIILIREVGGRGAADILRPLWEHNDQRIQMEVLGALLKFQDKWGLLFLRRALKSNDSEMVYQSVRLVEIYKVFEAADDLAAMLKKRPFFKSSYDHNQILLRALGSIGNPSIIPILKKMAGLSWSFFPQALADMQKILFRSLAGYPPESVRDLLYSGLSGRDEGIRKICQELLLHDIQPQP